MSRREAKLSMSLLLLLLLLPALATLASSQPAANGREDSDTPDVLALLRGKIKHIIVLMEENRSFDHFFGWGKRATPPLAVDGLTGDETNPLNASDPDSPSVAVNDRAPFINACDPNHGTEPTAEKIFGQQATAARNFTNPNMQGFVDYEHRAHHADPDSDEFCDVLNMFTPERLPVITALAQEFALFDRFFCSHPGPTWPNRMYALSGTTMGSTETGPWFKDIPGQLFPQPTIFDQVAEANLTWRNYYNDTPWELFLESVAHHPDNTRPLGEFFRDAATGDLPSFAWINPLLGINVSSGIGSNDQHPDHDVRAGEQLYKSVYEALRAGPAWNETLFILTFDEHGGFYDHVIPPNTGVPAPEDPPTPSYPYKDFHWDRLGVRIPTLLASPWIPKGTILHAPPTNQKPTNTSEYELTSIMSTARKLLGMTNVSPLTRRDAWSATFEHIFLPSFANMTAPREDCPMHLPDALPPSKLHLAREARTELNDLQDHVLTVTGHLSGASKGGRRIHHKDDGVVEQQHVGPWVHARFKEHREQRRAQHAQRTADSSSPSSSSFSPNKLSVVVDASNVVGPREAGRRHSSGSVLASEWSVPNVGLERVQPKLPWTTINVALPSNSHVTATVPLCLDHAQAPEVLLLPCGSGDGSHPSDPYQRWVIGTDAAIHAYPDTSLCLTSHGNDDATETNTTATRITLQYCEASVRQSMAFGGVALGGSEGPLVSIAFGNAWLVVSNATFA